MVLIQKNDLERLDFIEYYLPTEENIRSIILSQISKKTFIAYKNLLSKEDLAGQSIVILYDFMNNYGIKDINSFNEIDYRRFSKTLGRELNKVFGDSCKNEDGSYMNIHFEEYEQNKHDLFINNFFEENTQRNELSSFLNKYGFYSLTNTQKKTISTYYQHGLNIELTSKALDSSKQNIRQILKTTYKRLKREEEKFIHNKNTQLSSYEELIALNILKEHKEHFDEFCSTHNITNKEKYIHMSDKDITNRKYYLNKILKEGVV